MDRRIEEQLALLHAHMAVHRLALRALVRSHPFPDRALAAWRDARADAIAAAYAMPPDVRHSDWLTDQVQALSEDWTAELVDAAMAARQEAPG